MKRLTYTIGAAAALLGLAASVTGSAAAASVSLRADGPPRPAWSSAVEDPSATTNRPWRVVDLGTLGGRFSQGRAINDRGEIVGISSTGSTTHAFLWRDGQMTDLGTLGGRFSAAFDINNRGEIVGYSSTADGALHAFRWRDGRMTDLGSLDSGTRIATAINDRGEIVGDDDGPGGVRAFLWRDGALTYLDTPDGSGWSRAHDINNRGEIVGITAVRDVPFGVLWRDGRVVRLDENRTPAAINDRGQVTGSLYDNSGAYLWDRERFIDIDKPAGSTMIQTAGLNNRGTVVGSTDLGAFVWEHGRMSGLPSIGDMPNGARGINDRGQILGHIATMPDELHNHAALWTR